MSRIKILFVYIGLFFVPALFVQAASLGFNPGSGSYKVGDTISVKLILDAGSEQANAAEATVSFDNSTLSVKSVSKDGSAFTLWTKEPTISGTKGTVELGGGSPSGFSGQKTIATILFKAEKEGTALISVTAGSIVSPPTFADILTEKKEATFTIAAGSPNAKPEPKPVSTRPSALGPAPEAPTITSDYFVDPEIWYATTTGTFKWEKTFDVDAIKILLDDKDSSVPSKSYEATVLEQTFTDLPEGTSYLHVMFHNATGWGAPAHRKILVDVSPPKSFRVSASQDSPLTSQDVTLKFSTEDELSGIARYEIFIDGISTKTLTSAELVNGGYTVPVAKAGEHIFTVTAYDNAGNTAKAETTATVTEFVPQKKAEVSDVPPPVDTGINWSLWIIILLVAGVSFLVGSIMYERKAVRLEKEHIKLETDEVRDKLEGIFAVLRDEIEEQVVALSTKPNMTESERGILAKLKEALEMSEELLDKEIEDIRKLL